MCWFHYVASPSRIPQKALNLGEMGFLTLRKIQIRERLQDLARRNFLRLNGQVEQNESKKESKKGCNEAENQESVVSLRTRKDSCLRRISQNFQLLFGSQNEN